jgi:general secretion pathway protein E
MDCTDGLKKLLKDSAELAALQDAARSDGMVSLREVAIRKMLEGVTTYEEVVGMTG